MKWIPLILSLTMGIIHAHASAISPESSLMAGRCMVPIPNQKAVLRGQAPSDISAAPYSISNGITELWRGNAGEAFSIPAQPLTGQIYLHSNAPTTSPWQKMSWVQPSTQAANTPATQYLSGKKAGLQPNSAQDAGPALRQLLAQAAAAPDTQTTIELEHGTYHFYPEQAIEMSLYLSNHDQQDKHAVAIPLVNLNNTTIKANNSTFVFHGGILPVLIMDSDHITLDDIRITYAIPHETEGTIISTDEESTILEFDQTASWCVKNGRFCNLTGEGEQPVTSAFAFLQNKRVVPTGKAGDYPWLAHAHQDVPNQVKFSIPASKHGLKPGYKLVFHNGSRPRPAMAIYRAAHISLNNIVFHDSQGMALLAQRSEDITIRGGGCLRRGERVHTTTADATHFSNCRGSIVVENATYEGMLDDAINVHSTCLAIQSIPAPNRIICRYVHPQTVGFEIFLPGEKIQFIRSQTLENTTPLGKALQVKRLNERLLDITLQDPLPPDISIGDAIENADWYPTVTFCHNTIQDNRARGALFTTPRPVVIKKNHFNNSSGSAILLAGDAKGWYESGQCKDVLIQGNTFRNCLTNLYQFTRAIISISPEIAQPELQQKQYHRNIRIKNNTFFTHPAPLVSALSTEDLTFTGNQVYYDSSLSAMNKGRPFIWQHCQKLQLEPPTINHGWRTLARSLLLPH